MKKKDLKKDLEIEKKLNQQKTTKTIKKLLSSFLFIQTPITNKGGFINSNDGKKDIEKTLMSSTPKYSHSYFNPNNIDEIIKRITYIKTVSINNEMNNITTEQWLDWYLIANINYLEPEKHFKIRGNNFESKQILINFDEVNKALSIASVNSTPNTFVDVSRLIADKKASSSLLHVQKCIAQYNTADGYKKENMGYHLDNYAKYIINNFVRNFDKQHSEATSLTKIILLSNFLNKAYDDNVNYSAQNPYLVSTCDFYTTSILQKYTTKKQLKQLKKELKKKKEINDNLEYSNPKKRKDNEFSYNYIINTINNNIEKRRKKEINDSPLSLLKTFKNKLTNSHNKPIDQNYSKEKHR